MKGLQNAKLGHDPKLPSPKGKNYESYALKTKLKLDYIDLKYLTKWREEEI